MPFVPMQHADGTVTMEWVDEQSASTGATLSQEGGGFTGTVPRLTRGDWNRLPSGEMVWVDEAGRQTPNRPYEGPSTPSSERSGAGNFFSGLNPMPAVNNFFTGMENVAAGTDRWATVPQGSTIEARQARPARAQLEAASGLPMEPAYAPPGEPGTLPPIAEPSFAEFPEPEETQTNPGLSELVAYMREREGRSGALFDRVLQQIEGEQPNIWSRLGGMISAAAARDSWAESGAAANEYLASERAQRDSTRNQMLQLGLAREDLGGDVAEAIFNESTGRWEAGEATRGGRYRTRVANVEGRNEASQRSADRRTTAGVAGWQAERERYEADRQRLDRATLMGAQLGDPSSFSSIFGAMPEGMQRGIMERQATSGLAAMIASAGNRAHREMERIAGRTIARPPRTLRDDPQALARYYASNGVPLGHPDVLRAFPGMGGGE